MGGADSNCVVRNFINGLGYNCFATGATEVVLGDSLISHHSNMTDFLSLQDISQWDRLLFWKWVLILVIVITTTAHSQDIPDQAGDGARGRKTVPLVIGDTAARVSIVLGTGFWSVACCLFWQVGFASYFIVGGLAAVVSFRVCTFRSPRADKLTFLWWNGWVTSVYMLPTLKMWT
jgi:4-hydroxybenzoate polyprenyltransferase